MSVEIIAWLKKINGKFASPEGILIWGQDTLGYKRKVLVDENGRLIIKVDNFPSEYPLPASQVADLKNVTVTNIPTDYAKDSTVKGLKGTTTPRTLEDLYNRLGETLPRSVSGTVNVGNFPTDYPDNGTHSRLDDLKEALQSIGTDKFLTAPDNPPNLNLSLSALRDALRGADGRTLTDLYNKLGSISGSVSVANFPTDYPDSGAHSRLDDLKQALQSVGTDKLLTVPDNPPNLDLPLTSLRDALRGVDNRTLSDVYDRLAYYQGVERAVLYNFEPTSGADVFSTDITPLNPPCFFLIEYCVEAKPVSFIAYFVRKKDGNVYLENMNHGWDHFIGLRYRYIAYVSEGESINLRFLFGVYARLRYVKVVEFPLVPNLLVQEITNQPLCGHYFLVNFDDREIEVTETSYTLKKYVTINQYQLPFRSHSPQLTVRYRGDGTNTIYVQVKEHYSGGIVLTASTTSSSYVASYIFRTVNVFGSTWFMARGTRFDIYAYVTGGVGYIGRVHHEVFLHDTKPCNLETINKTYSAPVGTSTLTIVPQSECKRFISGFIKRIRIETSANVSVTAIRIKGDVTTTLYETVDPNSVLDREFDPPVGCHTGIEIVFNNTGTSPEDQKIYIELLS